MAQRWIPDEPPPAASARGTDPAPTETDHGPAHPAPRRAGSAPGAGDAELRALAELLPGGVFRADGDQRLTFVNEAGRRLLEVDGELAARLRDAVHPDDRGRHDEQLARLTAAPPGTTARYPVRMVDGDRVRILSCRSVLDPVGGARCYVGTLADLADEPDRPSGGGPDRPSGRDRLTGLPDGATVLAQLAGCLSDGPGPTLLVLVDLDGFTDVNEEWGRDVGDRVLVEMARRLGRCVRPGDVVGRYDDDEFAVLVPDAGVDAEGPLLHRLAGALAVPVSWSGGWWAPGASFGVARGEPGEAADDVVRRAARDVAEDQRRRRAAR